MTKTVIILLALALVAVVLGVGSWLFMYAWNYTIPVVFGLTKITFWQALWMWLLSGLIFKTPNFNWKK